DALCGPGQNELARKRDGRGPRLVSVGGLAPPQAARQDAHFPLCRLSPRRLGEFASSICITCFTCITCFPHHLRCPSCRRKKKAFKEHGICGIIASILALLVGIELILYTFLIPDT